SVGGRSGGAALSGGFYEDPNWSLAPGHTLGWVQIVSTTRPGTDNIWGITAMNSIYPDTNSLNNPNYPFQSTAETPPNPPGAPTVGFQDFPRRNFANGAQRWIAELGLVCYVTVDGVTQAYVLDTFTWGFRVNVNPNSISPILPNFFGPPSNTFISTLNAFY